MFDLNKGFKIDSVNIKNHKMFRDFKISFTDSYDNPLPIIVIAGINGSGKTTLLEYIFSPKKLNDIIKWIPKNHNVQNNNIEIGIQKASAGDAQAKSGFSDKESVEPLLVRKNEFIGDESLKIKTLVEKIEREEYQKNIFYIPVGIDDISKIEAEFVKYWYNQVKFHNKRNDEIAEELQKFIVETLNGLDLNFTYSHIDENDKIFFKNYKEEKFRIDELSTGEKVLLSKVLYLFIKGIKNKVILIDEPELSLHPAWQNRVLKLYENFAKENNCQIIIATHSPHILGSAKSEYVRLLTEDGVVDNFSNTYGAKFSQILTDIMGVRDLRTPEINEKFVVIEDMIIDNKFDTQEFKEKWQELENILGKNYFDLKLLKLEIASRRKDVQNNQK